MSDIVLQKNVASLIAPETSIVPQAATASVNGTSHDRGNHSMPLSCALYTTLGAVTGSPTSFTVQSKVQDSADGTTFADYKPDGVNTAQDAAALTAASTAQWTAVDLTNARRYVRAVSTISFTGGTSPSIEIATVVIFGGENTLAAV